MADYRTPGVYIESAAPDSNTANNNIPTESKETWPLVKFSFKIVWGDNELVFQEATGINSDKLSENEPGTVVMKNGIFKGDPGVWDKMETMEQPSILISLLDESNNAAMTWTLTNAQPSNMKKSDAESEGNEIAIESLEIAYETLVVSS